MARSLAAGVSTGIWLLLLAPGPAIAQRDLPLEADGLVLRLELAKPIFSVGQFQDAHLATTAWDVSALLPVHPAVALFGQVGITFGQIGGLAWSGATSNPRLGAAIGRDRGLSASVYTDLPLSQEMGNDFAGGVGHVTHFEDWARYGTEYWGVGGSATAEAELAPAAFAGARFDGVLLLPLDVDMEQDAFGVLTAYADAPTGAARIWIEISCFALLTQPALSFDQRTAFFGTVSLSLPTRRFAPEAYVRVPLDENVSGIISFVLGGRLHIGSTRPSR